MYRSEAFTESLHCPAPDIDLESLRGVDQLKRQLSGFADMQRANDVSRALGLSSSGVLLINGRSGDRRAFYARALMGELAKRGYSTLIFSPQSFLAGGSAEFEKRLTKAFNEVIVSAPCAVICSDIELFCPERSSAHSTEDKLRTLTFISLFQELRSVDAQFAFIGLTAFPHDVDIEFVGLTDEIIDIPLPDISARKAYITELLDGLPCHSEAAARMAECTAHFGCSDIRRLCACARRSVYDELEERFGGDEQQAAQCVKEGGAYLSPELVESALDDFFGIYWE